MPARDSYELGKAMCKTWADMINYDMEHELFDLAELHEFMRGLADGGGTRSGHRMPVVFVTCPGAGPERSLYAGQQLGTGTDTGHGRDGHPDLPRPRSQRRWKLRRTWPAAIPSTIRVCPSWPRQGLRGASASFANQVWGMNNAQYVRIADLWPLNPKGEILFGLKIEDTFADANAEASLAVPGVAFAEWGPTDNNYWLSNFDGLPLDGSRFDETKFPRMMAVHDMVLRLCKKHNVRYLNLATNVPGTFNYVLNQIGDGAMLLVGSEETAFVGREHTKRRMPI